MRPNVVIINAWCGKLDAAQIISGLRGYKLSSDDAPAYLIGTGQVGASAVQPLLKPYVDQLIAKPVNYTTILRFSSERQHKPLQGPER